MSVKAVRVVVVGGGLVWRWRVGIDQRS